MFWRVRPTQIISSFMYTQLQFPTLHYYDSTATPTPEENIKLRWSSDLSKDICIGTERPPQQGATTSTHEILWPTDANPLALIP